MGLGLGFGLENKGRSKEDLRHYYAFDGKLGHHSPHVNTYVTYMYVPLGLVAGRSSSECWQKFSDTLKAALLRLFSLQEVVDNFLTTA